MEIRDPVHGALPLSKAELRVVDSRPLQRLRRIKQLGFAEFAFPGASHNRFSHSLGAMFLAGEAFDRIFASCSFAKAENRDRFRRIVRLAALLHDVGHGPLSHAAERAMPDAVLLKIPYVSLQDKRASHEHYSLKFILDSELSPLIESNGVDPREIAALMSSEVAVPTDTFIDDGRDFRPILSQLVSSELDVDRMDYLLRDSYYTGVSYGKYDLLWLLSNLSYHEVEGRLYLALQRRAIHAFEDFLLSRYHMYLMVYFHHLSVIYEEMLAWHFEHEARDFRFPAALEEYLGFDDYSLFTRLAQSGHDFARRISTHQAHRLLREEHDPEGGSKLGSLAALLQEAGILCLRSSSSGALSRYWKPGVYRSNPIFVVDWSGLHPIAPIERSTAVFSRYAESKVINRLYVPRERWREAKELLRASP
jgi:HD superfamily phosphohydrolase